MNLGVCLLQKWNHNKNPGLKQITLCQEAGTVAFWVNLRVSVYLCHTSLLCALTGPRNVLFQIVQTPDESNIIYQVSRMSMFQLEQAITQRSLR